MKQFSFQPLDMILSPIILIAKKRISNKELLVE